ncbi:hypothetical protein KGQ27_03455 [Patescibacteria group bacterium]|nr:hypothetical protein [Patescibacteria group bacterium]MDE1946909.1 hypothetical protein [Patescibacteria group bacterium]MDE2011110.1 hypothetical protein [Patescibacteria group bacterium]MDE2233198.1 hypothetical protein [Patescibacteria group bacterium]
MAKPIITVSAVNGQKLVKFEIPGGVTTPAEFAEASEAVKDQLPGETPVLVNGLGLRHAGAWCPSHSGGRHV